MKKIITTLFVISVTSAAAQTAATPDQDFDLACAVTTAAEVGSNPRESEVGRMAFIINTFYLGRLSGREPNTYWQAIVTGKLAELKERARDKVMFGSCTDLFIKQR